MTDVPVTHICLLNEYPTSILTPIIDPYIPSQKLVIASVEEYSLQAEQIIKLAKTRGYQAEHYLLPNTTHTLELKMAFLALFEKERETGNDVWLNASNGTRYQALAAFEVARSFNLAVYVVDPDNDALHWLHPDDKPPTPIQDKLKLHEYFSLHGVRLVSQLNKQGITSNIRQLGASWAAQCLEIGTSLAKLNYLASSAQGDNLISMPMDHNMLSDTNLAYLIDDLEDNRMLLRQTDKRLKFTNADTKFFCNGGWLEEYVFGLFHGLRKDLKTIQDIAHSAEIERQTDGRTVKNELDVVALVNNKLHLIECKTKRMNESVGTNTLYKLDSLNDLLGGMVSKAALVTFHKISDSDKARAAELDIAIFGPDKLPNLRSYLTNWLKMSS